MKKFYKENRSFLRFFKKRFNRNLIQSFFKDDFKLFKFLSKINTSKGLLFLLYRELSPKFRIQNNKYNYFYHNYRRTWNNERAVEVPIIWEIVNRYKDKEILEVGNVLSHYYNVNHDIVDKYEVSDSVINKDIIDYQTNKKYELVISISTLEHVGWNEIPEDPAKVLTVLDNLMKILDRNGKIIITLPIGWNPHLDKLLKENKITFYKRICLKRISQKNHWREVKWKDIQNIKYDNPFHSANGLLILFIKHHFIDFKNIEK